MNAAIRAGSANGQARAVNVADTEVALAEALAAAKRGWRVVPMYGVDDAGRCTCRKRGGCASAGKHPRLTRFLDIASADPDRVRSWGRKWPRCNWGLVCGSESGVVVLDVDPRNNGDVTLAELLRQAGGSSRELPRMPRCHSGGGGLHLDFLHPRSAWVVESRQDGLGRGLDVKGDGGVVVLAGSVHPTGTRYLWDVEDHPDRLPLGRMPVWLRERLVTERTERTEGTELTEETEDIEEDKRRPSVLSVHSVLSVTPPSVESPPPTLPVAENVSAPATPAAAHPVNPAVGDVDEAIESTLPTTPGQRNRCVFNLARALRAVPSLADRPASALKGIVRRWHAAALPVLGTKPFEDTWADFARGWGQVRYPRGTGVLAEALAAADAALDPPEAMEYDAPETRRLVRLCRELQRRAGDKPFFLACATAGALLGLDKMTAWRRLDVLVVDGVPAVADAHTPARATRYRYLGTLGGAQP
jgi:hypothetical protein